MDPVTAPAPTSEAPAPVAPATLSEDKAFTQADLDAKVEERLRRERQKFGDYDDLKRKAEEHDKLTQAQKTEHQKEVERARNEARDQAIAEGHQERFADKVEVLAAKAGFADTEDAVLRMGPRFDEFKPKDGNFDIAAIDAALKQLLKEKPHLAATEPDDTKKVGQVTGGPRQSSPSSENVTAAERLRRGYASNK